MDEATDQELRLHVAHLAALEVTIAWSFRRLVVRGVIGEADLQYLEDLDVETLVEPSRDEADRPMRRLAIKHFSAVIRRILETARGDGA